MPDDRAVPLPRPRPLCSSLPRFWLGQSVPRTSALPGRPAPRPRISSPAKRVCETAFYRGYPVARPAPKPVPANPHFSVAGANCLLVSPSLDPRLERGVLSPVLSPNTTEKMAEWLGCSGFDPRPKDRIHLPPVKSHANFQSLSEVVSVPLSWRRP